MIVVALALILSVTTYAFAATNTVPATNAGDGSETISGYTVTDVTYTLDGTDPSTITAVAFTITPDAGGANAESVSVRLETAGTWATCSVTGTAATCTVNVPALDADNLQVVAAQ